MYESVPKYHYLQGAGPEPAVCVFIASLDAAENIVISNYMEQHNHQQRPQVRALRCCVAFFLLTQRIQLSSSLKIVGPRTRKVQPATDNPVCSRIQMTVSSSRNAIGGRSANRPKSKLALRQTVQEIGLQCVGWRIPPLWGSAHLRVCVTYPRRLDDSHEYAARGAFREGDRRIGINYPD